MKCLFLPIILSTLAGAYEAQPSDIENIETVKNTYLAYVDCTSQALDLYKDIDESVKTIAEAALGKCSAERSQFIRVLLLTYFTTDKARELADQKDEEILRVLMSRLMDYRQSKNND